MLLGSWLLLDEVVSWVVLEVEGVAFLCVSQWPVLVGRVDILVATRWAKELTPYMTTMPFFEISSRPCRAHIRIEGGKPGLCGLTGSKEWHHWLGWRSVS